MYVYDGWQLGLEFKSSSGWKPWRQYIWGGTYIDEPIAYTQDGDLDGDFDDAEAVRFFPLQQANYNVAAVAKDDEVGSVSLVETVAYDPYGQPDVAVEQGQSATGNVLLFQGQRWDADAGFYYFRNRWLDPVLGRFLQRDSDETASAANLYSAFREDPTRLKDPSGNECLPDSCVICCVSEIVNVPLVKDHTGVWVSIEKPGGTDASMSAYDLCLEAAKYGGALAQSMISRTFSHFGYCKPYDCKVWLPRWKRENFRKLQDCIDRYAIQSGMLVGDNSVEGEFVMLQTELDFSPVSVRM